MSPSSPRERLDVETHDSREARLGTLFSSLSNPSGTATPASGQGLPLPPLAPSRPHFVPPSAALARAQAFLPLLAASNADLLARAQADPTSVNIEAPTKGDVVAMDIGIGVFDVDGQVEGVNGLGPVVEGDPEVWKRAAADADTDEDDDEEEEEDDEDDHDDASDSDEDDDESNEHSSESESIQLEEVESRTNNTI